MLQNLTGQPVLNTVIKNCDVGGFSWFAATVGDFPGAPLQGDWGANIMWEGTGGAGFDGITIVSCKVHGLNGPKSTDDQGIGGFGGGPIKNVTITNTQVWDIGGGPVGLASGLAYPPMGNGIGFTGIQTGSITNCTVHDCGANFYNEGGGPAGILLSDCRGVIVSNCEAYRIQPSPWTPGVDRIGFDIDNNCQDCYIDHCLAHDNFNSGFLLFSNGDPNWTRNGIRNCTSANNCWGGYTGFGEIGISIPGGNPALDVTDNLVSNNRVYTGQLYQNPNQGAVGISITGGGTFTGEIARNTLTLSADIYGQTTPINARTNSTFTPAVSIHNNTYHIQSGTVNFWWANAQYPSLAAWQTASGKGQGDVIS
jgi:hypothetical protein